MAVGREPSRFGSECRVVFRQAASGASSMRPTAIGMCPASRTSVAAGEEFRWFRSRIIGGRTVPLWPHFAALSDYDFKPQEFDGLGFDWPVTYEEMSPWYDKAEEFIGVTGTQEVACAARRMGSFMPPVAPRVHEMLVQRAGKKLNIPVIPSRMAMLTKAINGRAACHYCGQCGRGYPRNTAFTSEPVGR